MTRTGDGVAEYDAKCRKWTKTYRPLPGFIRSVRVLRALLRFYLSLSPDISGRRLPCVAGMPGMKTPEAEWTIVP